MRSLVNKKDKSKQNQWILGIFLIIVMLFSVLGYALGGGDNQDNKKIEYNDIEFIQDNSEYWNFNIQGNNFMTKYNPEETKDISFFTYSQINDYVSKPLYLVGKFQEPNYEIIRNLNNLVLRAQNACLSEKDCLDNLPIKNCSVDNIIVIQEPLVETDKGNIYQQENCIFITANLGNQTRYVDKFLFQILGIK